MAMRSLKWTIIGVTVFILIFISWPKFQLFQCRSTQSEAKAWLYHLYEAEQFYFAHHHSYASLEMLIQEGLVKSSEKNYTYKTSHYDDKRFVIQATAKNLHDDSWTVDQTGTIRAEFDACTL